MLCAVVNWVFAVASIAKKFKLRTASLQRSHEIFAGRAKVHAIAEERGLVAD